jgi:D-alanine-D-alanine ligase
MNLDPAHTRVALLAGGTSEEREISIASGKGAQEALEQAGFTVTVLDPAEKTDLKKLIDGLFDVAFLCLHGRCGEDGTMQGMLEVIGLPYTGPGVWASATAMNKAKAKIYYEENGIPTPRSITLHGRHEVSVEYLHDHLGNCIVVKPAAEGSALGVTIVRTMEDMENALDQAFLLDNTVLAETYVSGIELTVAVIGNDDVRALPVIEIIPQSDFYDFESKYAPGGSQHICPARLDDETTRRVQEIAVAAHRSLDCQGVSRTDIILDGQGTCWVLETNTIPGMTATSLLPDAGRAAGIDFPELCAELIRLALERG